MEPRDPLAIGIDAGGTKIAGLLVDERGTILDRRLARTPATDAEASVDAMISLATDFTAGHDGIVGVGAGAAGLVSLDGVMRFAPNVAWRGVPAAGPPRGGDRPARDRRQRRERRRLGRVPLRRGTGFERHAAGHGRHRHRWRDRGRGRAVSRGARLRRRDRSHHRGARRAPLRLRQPRVLGAGRLGPGHRPARAGRGRGASGIDDDQARGRRLRDHGSDRHRGREAWRSDRRADPGRRGPPARRGHRGARERPGSRRGRRGRRRDRGRRPPAGLGAVGVRRFGRGPHPSSRGADPRGRAGQRRRSRRGRRPGAAAGGRGNERRPGGG